MRRQIISPLCSAFVIPGLGQVINHHIKKGLILLGMVFILFIAGTVKLAFILTSLITPQMIANMDKALLLDNLKNKDLSLLYLLVITFGLLWLYSIIDALWYGRKIDRNMGDIIS